MNYLEDLKLIIAGGRNFNCTFGVDPGIRLFCKAALQDSRWADRRRCCDEVFCGEADGADSDGKKWASRQGLKVRSFRPDWDRLGIKAGYIRNDEMGAEAHALLAFWDGKTPGTRHMINNMKKQKKPVVVVYYDVDAYTGFSIIRENHVGYHFDWMANGYSTLLLSEVDL